MTETTKTQVTHATFTIEREFAAPPSRVFRAFADPELKARWFAGPADWTTLERTHDFRVGGTDVLHGKFGSGMESLYAARYHAIEDGERLVYCYDMRVDGKHLSVSVATIELEPAGSGTRMQYTEQAVYFDAPGGHADREEGTRVLFDRLATVL